VRGETDRGGPVAPERLDRSGPLVELHRDIAGLLRLSAAEVLGEGHASALAPERLHGRTVDPTRPVGPVSFAASVLVGVEPGAQVLGGIEPVDDPVLAGAWAGKPRLPCDWETCSPRR
jgi:hypothetical protein